MVNFHYDEVPEELKKAFNDFVNGHQSSSLIDSPLLGGLLGGTHTNDTDALDPYKLYLLLQRFIRSGYFYNIFLTIFAVLSWIINLAVIVTLIYQIKLKIRTRHIIFLNLCVTEMLTALWEVSKDPILMIAQDGTIESYFIIVPAIIMQGATSLTVIMMVFLGADTYFAIKTPFRYMRVCGRSKRIGVLVVSVSWCISLLIWTVVNCLQGWFMRKYGIGAITTLNLCVQVVSIFFMSVILISAAVLQFRVYLEVRHSVMANGNTNDGTQLRRYSVSIKTSTMSKLTRKSFYFSMSTVALAVLFWLPYIVFEIVTSIQIMISSLTDFDTYIMTHSVLHLIYSLNTFLTPALYAFRIRNPFTSLANMVKELHYKIWRLKKLHRGSEGENNSSGASSNNSNQNSAQTQHSSENSLHQTLDGLANRKLKKSMAIIRRRIKTRESSMPSVRRAKRIRTRSEPIIFGCDNCGSVFIISEAETPTPPQSPSIGPLVHFPNDVNNSNNNNINNETSSTIIIKTRRQSRQSTGNITTTCNHQRRHRHQPLASVESDTSTIVIEDPLADVNDVEDIFAI